MYSGKYCHIVISILLILTEPVWGDQDSQYFHYLRNNPCFCGNGYCESFLGENPDTCPDDCQVLPMITGSAITWGPYEPVPSHGDLWLSTWADDGTPDGKLYITWGDGCGPGFHFGDPGCQEWSWDTDIADVGVAFFTGTVPSLQCSMTSSGCLSYPNIPDGISGYPHTAHDDKPASVLALDGRLYLAGFSPQRQPAVGYIAFSEDDGATWQMGNGNPWREEYTHSPRSYFRCLMFINMGQNYEFNTDGYIYALGIGWGWDWDMIGDGHVYLTRVPRDSVASYQSYRYFTGMQGDTPTWSSDEYQAVPLKGLVAYSGGSAIYHPYLNRYLFLFNNGIYEAPQPWGPWTLVSPLLWWGNDPGWYGSDAPGLIPKDMGPDYVYFTTSGRSDVLRYAMLIGKITFSLRSETGPDTESSAPETRTGCLVVDGHRLENSSPDGEPGTDGIIPPDWESCSPGPSSGLPDRHRSDAWQALKLPPRPSPVSISVDPFFPADYSRNAGISAPPAPSRPCHELVLVESPGVMTLQVALDQVCDEGRIRVGDGIYRGSGNRDLEFRGKKVVMESMNGSSRTIIDCEYRGRAFYIHQNEGLETHIKGFTIRHGFSRSAGGGAYCFFASPKWEDCVFTSCIAYTIGGGIATYYSDSILLNCRFEDNLAGTAGGAVGCYYYSDLDLQDCAIIKNESVVWGGGFFSEISDARLIGCSVYDNFGLRGGGASLHNACMITIQNSWFVRNRALISGGGIYHNIPCWSVCPDSMFRLENCTLWQNQIITQSNDSVGGAFHSIAACPDATIHNCIFWNNHAVQGSEMALEGFGHLIISHCNVQGGQSGLYCQGLWYNEWLDGMIDADPGLVAGPLGDCYLGQRATGQLFDSPCLNAGRLSAQDTCYFGHEGQDVRCLSEYTTRTDQIPDQDQVDLGAHYPRLITIPVMNLWGIIICMMIMAGIIAWCGLR